MSFFAVTIDGIIVIFSPGLDVPFSFYFAYHFQRHYFTRIAYACVSVCVRVHFLHIHFVFNSTLTNTEIITTAVQYLILKLCQVCCLPHTNAFSLLILNDFFLLSSFSNLIRYSRSLFFVVVVVCVHFVHFGFHMEVGFEFTEFFYIRSTWKSFMNSSFCTVL